MNLEIEEDDEEEDSLFGFRITFLSEFSGKRMESRLLTRFSATVVMRTTAAEKRAAY